MSDHSNTHVACFSRCALAGFALAAAALVPLKSAEARDEAAHAIVDRFAREHAATEQKAVAEAKRKAEREALQRRQVDEREMLARARAEAAERKSAEEQRSAAAAELRRAEDMTARIRADAEAREAEMKRRAAEIVSEEERERVAAARMHQMETARTAELDRLTAQLRRIEEAADQRATLQRARREQQSINPNTDTLNTTARHYPARRVPDVATATTTGASQLPALGSQRVTVLMVLEPGNRGMRRFGNTADPVVCMERHCFISNGASEPARAVTRWQAFGTFNTLGARAGACRNSLTCAFPAIDLEVEGRHVQPVDLRIMRHDRREVREIVPDQTCAITSRRLVCGNPVASQTWRAWVVPQAIADAAGPELIAAALAGRLSRDRVAAR